MTTKKAADFASMGLRDDNRQFRSLEVLPGFGPVAREKMAEHGFTTVAHLLGQFLLFSCDTDLMKDWLKEKLPTHADRHVDATCVALKDWTDNHL